MRGLLLAQILQMKVETIAKLLPRITVPTLIAAEVEDLDPADVVALYIEVAAFFGAEGGDGIPEHVEDAMADVATGMVDKGTFTVDEIEHSGAPDSVSLRCRSAELRSTLRQRASQSWHGAIMRDIAARNKLTAKVDETLAAIVVQHIDQTNESDVHFLTRIGRQHDAVATVKKGRLVFLPLGSTSNTAGKEIQAVTNTRSKGNRHRYHSAARDSYTGVRVY